KVPFRFCLHPGAEQHWMQLEGGTTQLVPDAVRVVDRFENVVEERLCMRMRAGDKGHSPVTESFDTPPLVWVVVSVPSQIVGAYALFVKRYGIANVPGMYIITPIAMLAVSALIFFFIDRMRRRTMLLVYVASVTIFSIALQYAITTEVIGKIVQPISYVFAHGVKETIYILFWVYAGNLYD